MTYSPRPGVATCSCGWEKSFLHVTALDAAAGLAEQAMYEHQNKTKQKERNAA
jgi:hypothetical protein